MGQNVIEPDYKKLFNDYRRQIGIPKGDSRPYLKITPHGGMFPSLAQSFKVPIEGKVEDVQLAVWEALESYEDGKNFDAKVTAIGAEDSCRTIDGGVIGSDVRVLELVAQFADEIRAPKFGMQG